MDSVSYTVALVRILANNDEVLITDHYKELLIGDDIYLSCPSMEFGLSEQTGDFTDAEATINNVSYEFGTIANISGGYPYNTITVKVSEVTLDESFNALSTVVLFQGMLYASKRGLTSGYVDLTLRNWKYYTNITGGNCCTENCSVRYFGDKICRKIVREEEVVITNIDDGYITVTPDPSADDFLYNKGYVSYNGVNIKILYWESGSSMQTKYAVPSGWLGQTVTLHAGCDRTLDACKNIHDNEANFYGLGISMVDYDPRAERY